MTSLKPCPFCGGNARLTTWTPTAASISCIMCGAHFNTYTKAEAIAAWNTRHVETCEPPYDELLRCLENDWHISASWDGLRKFWCIELTEEGVKLRDATHGTLTTEQVREAIERHSAWVIGNNRCFHDGAYEAIADELNAERHVETCELEYIETYEYPDGEEDYLCKCSECGRTSWEPAHNLPKFCGGCGKAVKR